MDGGREQPESNVRVYVQEERKRTPNPPQLSGAARSPLALWRSASARLGCEEMAPTPLNWTFLEALLTSRGSPLQSSPEDHLAASFHTRAVAIFS